jgi:hypothetical protein
MLPPSQLRLDLHNRSLGCVNTLKISQTFEDSHHPEQMCLRAHQRVVTTVEDSVLHTEMTSLVSQEVDVLRHVLFVQAHELVGTNQVSSQK